MMMMWLVGIALLQLLQTALGCFCPSCGCGSPYGGSYGSYSGQYAQPQSPYAPTVIWYPRPIPIGNPFPATGYVSPPQPPRPVYYPPQIPQYRQPSQQVQTVLVPRPRVETVYGGANAIPPVEDIPIPAYRPDPVRPIQPQPTEAPEEIIREIEVVTEAPRPVQTVQPVQKLRPRPIWTTTARTTTTTEEIIVEEVVEETQPIPVRTTTRAHFEVPVFNTQPVIATTTEGPKVEGTTRLVHIPRKKGDGKNSDYEYYYVYYDEKNGTTTKTDQVIELDKKADETATEETEATDYDFDSGTETEKTTAAVISGKGDVKESDKYEKTRGAIGGKQEIETVDEAPVNGNKIGENEEFVYYEVDEDQAAGNATAPVKQIQVEGGSQKTFAEYQDETTVVEGQQPDNKEKEGDSSTELQYPRKAEVYDYKHKRENRKINDAMVVRRKKLHL